MEKTASILKNLLKVNLQLGELVESFTDETPLLGELSELDSMSVVNVIMAIEDTFNFSIEDGEINADMFETFGSLLKFIESKT